MLMKINQLKSLSGDVDDNKSSYMKSDDEWRVTRNRQSTRVEKRAGPTANSPRDTLSRFGYRRCPVRR